MSLKVETSEAICSALYMLDFSDFLGETDERRRGERTAWFHLGESPKDMQVAVTTPDDAEQVLVTLRWRNYAGDPRNPLACSQTLQVSTYAAQESELRKATEAAVIRVLEVYRDVLAEEGVAGKIEALQETEPAEDEPGS